MSKLKENVKKALFEAFSKKGFTPYSEKYKYYVKCLDENIIGGPMSPEHEQMFKDGYGSEIEDCVKPAKAKAIYSSSMLSYNFFRNINNCPIESDGIKYDKVYFEVQLRTLKSSKTPANIDVALVSEGGESVLFIESKFLEYLEDKPAKIPESYTKEKSYFEDNKEREYLLMMLRRFMEDDKKGLYNGYVDGIKQNICHLIGISNLNQSVTARKKFEEKYGNHHPILEAKAYRFMNILFCPKDNDAEEAYKNYRKDLDEFRESLPPVIKEYIGHPFIMTYRDLFNILPEELNVRGKLKERYINYHSEKEWK